MGRVGTTIIMPTRHRHATDTAGGNPTWLGSRSMPCSRSASSGMLLYLLQDWRRPLRRGRCGVRPEVPTKIDLTGATDFADQKSPTKLPLSSRCCWQTWLRGRRQKAWRVRAIAGQLQIACRAVACEARYLRGLRRGVWTSPWASDTALAPGPDVRSNRLHSCLSIVGKGCSPTRTARPH